MLNNQELQKLYKQLLLSDLPYALEKKVEVDLWNYCFKDYIAYLQLEVNNFKTNKASSDNEELFGRHLEQRNNGGVRRTTKLTGVDPDIALQWVLEFASGFYIALIQELRACFGTKWPVQLGKFWLQQNMVSHDKNAHEKCKA